MEFTRAMPRRRLIRKYTREPVSREQLTALLAAAMHAPGACSKRPWEFYVITDKAVLEQLPGASGGSSYEAPDERGGYDEECVRFVG